jgi:hypothetical protein
MNNDDRGHWYLLTGLLIGLAIGLLYTWVVNPVQFTDAAPSALKAEFKDAYRSLIAQAYQADGDVGRARGRLELLKDPQMAYALGDQAQRLIASGGSQQEARSLAQLAADLGTSLATEIPEMTATSATTATPQPTGTPQLEASATVTLNEADMIQTATIEPSVTVTPQATFTSRAQSQPTLSSPLVLKERKDVCDAELPAGLLQVEVKDQDGEPMAGVKINITWSGGQDNFYTGLYPEKGAGYADFDMSPSMVYSLRAGEAGEVVNNISPKQCTTSDGKTFLGGVSLKFGE